MKKSLLRKVAEAVGWKFERGKDWRDTHYRVFSPKGKQKYILDNGHDSEWIHPEDFHEVLPNYNTDLDAAWPLLNEMINAGAISDEQCLFLTRSYPAKDAAAFICETYLEWKAGNHD